jgi:hypothetical protein
MTSRRTFGSAAAAAAIAALALPGAAGASAGKRSFAQTYPVASRLCAAVSSGKGPRRLHRSTARVLADCSMLQGNFTAATAAVLATDAALTAQAAPARAALAVMCTGNDKAKLACLKAHDADRAVLAQLRRQRVHAAQIYYESLETSRKAFWSAIRALPGGRDLREDARIRVQES